MSNVFVCEYCGYTLLFNANENISVAVCRCSYCGGRLIRRQDTSDEKPKRQKQTIFSEKKPKLQQNNY